MEVVFDTRAEKLEENEIIGVLVLTGTDVKYDEGDKLVERVLQTEFVLIGVLLNVNNTEYDCEGVIEDEYDALKDGDDDRVFRVVDD